MESLRISEETTSTALVPDNGENADSRLHADDELEDLQSILKRVDESTSDDSFVSDDDYDGSNDMPQTSAGLATYHYAHARAHLILYRIERMLGCRAQGEYMFHVRKVVKHSRMADLHEKCAEILDGEDSELLMELVLLFEKFLPISGVLNSDEYQQLLNGQEPVSIPPQTIKGNGLCQLCRNLNLRRETFEVGTTRYVTSLMGDHGLDEVCSDADLERQVPHDPTEPHIKHHKLGHLKDIMNRSECSFCALVKDCFLRISPEELTLYKFKSVIENWCYDGVVWLSLLHDPVGDHSEKYRDERGDSKKDLLVHDSLIRTGRTRVILSVLPEDEEQDDDKFKTPFELIHSEILPFANNNAEEGFQVRKWSGPFIDIDRPQKWLHACETYHGEACSAPGNYGHMEIHENMLLIDLQEQCLVSGFKSRRYFALSYVWGSGYATSFETTMATIDDLMKPRGLDLYIKEIANTILDAMAFTTNMEIRYLWVDALCIVQDDPELKPIQINNMDAIYRQAVLTLVAGDNLSARDGLSGVGSRPREGLQRTYEYRPDLTLTANEAVIGDVEVVAMQSKWASRAWTFQERSFSRRLLLFVDSTVYWNCSCLRWSETEPNPSEDMPPPWKYYNGPVFRDNPSLYLKGLGLPGDNSIIFVWQNVVRTIVDLDFTFEDDILIALAGMENYVAQYFDTSFVFGNPRKSFADFLLWLPASSSFRKRNVEGIPSWSWAAWIGGLAFPELEPQNQKMKEIRRLHVKMPKLDITSKSRVSMSSSHSGILDIHTMISKIRIVDATTVDEDRPLPDCPELGRTMVYAMPTEIRNETGKCVGCCSMFEEEVDGLYEAIVVAQKLYRDDDDSIVLPSYWIIIIQWKGQVAERIGLGLITSTAWNETGPTWRDVKLS